jgi:hypothetical protein
MNGTTASFTSLGLRAILASRVLERRRRTLGERAYGRLSELRSEAIVALAPDGVLDAFNSWAYSHLDWYKPQSPSYKATLFPWEERVIARYFPRPPARVLLGGAGAGREALQLAAAGFDVVAFEPTPLAESIAVQAHQHGVSVDVYRGDYEGLPRLTSVAGGSVTDLRARAPFDAAIFGWGSFSHLRTHASRLAALTTVAGMTRGPILVSLIAARAGDAGVGGLRRWLLARRGRAPGDSFAMSLGFFHRADSQELHALAGAAGLEVLDEQWEGGEHLAPYVVLAPSVR